VLERKVWSGVWATGLLGQRSVGGSEGDGPRSVAAAPELKLPNPVRVHCELN
jgi:hypothetical protein